MYLGTYYHTVEEKGRISLPVKFRTQLGKKPVMTRGLDGCLFIFSQAEWSDFSQGIEETTITKKTHRDFARLMANEATELEIDAQGRALVPEHLRKLAKLSKHVVFAGSVNRVELWDRAMYHEYAEGLEKKAEDIAESIELPARKVGADDKRI